MSKKEIIIYAWDAATWIAWLRKEEDKNLAAIAAVVDEVQSGKAIIVTSAITDVEILELDASDDAFNTYRKLKMRPEIQTYDVQQRVIDKAREIRQVLNDENKAAKQNKPPKVKATDSVHAATAALAKVNAFHTYDRGLLSISGHAVINGVTCSEPRTLTGQALFVETSEFDFDGVQSPVDYLRKK